MIKVMRHEMRFVVLALLAVLCFASTGCVQSSVSSDAKDAKEDPTAALKELIKKDVKEDNESCPMNLDNGVIYASVEYDEDANTVIYKYLVENFDNLDGGDGALKESLLSALADACDNDDSIAYFKAVVETGTNLVYRYSTNDDYREIVIKPSDLQAGLPQLKK